MTVKLITSTNRYIGDTADTKPTGVPAGSTYFDRQTGIMYITYDGTNYVEKPSEDILATLIGEVDASPTANTVLDRLKDLATLLAGGLPAALAAGGGLKVDGSGTAIPVSGTFWQTTQPCSDAGPSWTSVWGVAGVPVTSADMSAAAVAVTDAPTGGQKLVIDDIAICSDTTLKFTLTEETSGTVRAYARCPAGSTVPLTWRGKMKLATADKKLLCQSSAAGNVEVLIGYHSEA